MHFEDLPRGKPGTHVESGSAVRDLWLNPALLDDGFWQHNARKILLGAALDGDLVGITDNRHLITVAGSRAGKGVSAIIPNLLAYEGSVLVLDPKGENATIAAERRGRPVRRSGDPPPEGSEWLTAGGMGHEVHVIDPFGAAKVPDEFRSGFNPLTALDVTSPEFIDDCDAMADALVISESGKENDFWSSSARLVLRGYIAWVAAWGKIPDSMRNLETVYRMLTAPPRELENYLQKILNNPGVAFGVPYQAASFLLGTEKRTRSNVLAVVNQHISFLASPSVKKMFAGTGRKPNLHEWKYGGQDIFLCLPAMRLHRHSRFFRLFVTMLLLAVERGSKKDNAPKQPLIPALMILDEMHVLGYMPALETAAGLIAGYGVRIWSIWQDFAQLKTIYDDRWETFLGNASIFQSFGLNDLTTLQYVSERLGTSPTIQVSESEISREQRAQGFTGKSKSLEAGPLLSPSEVAYFFSRQARNALVIYPGVDPIFLKRVEYFSRREFAGMFKGDDDAGRQ